MPSADQVHSIIRTARDAAALVEPMFAGLAEEKLAVIHLDKNRRLLGVAESGPEAETEVNLPIRSIIADAIRFGSAGLIVAHNHPSGDPAPSAADVEATRRLIAVTSELNITLHDHLIFAGGRIGSFRALGLL